MSHLNRKDKQVLKPERTTLNLMGLVVSKSPLIEKKNGNKMFFFELLWSYNHLFVVAKGYQWELYTQVPIHKYIFLSNIISTTITKGLDERTKVYACTSLTQISVKERSQLLSLEQDEGGHHAAIDDPVRSSTTLLVTNEDINEHSGTSYRGKVTKIIDASSGIYELDSTIRLCMTYLNKDVNCLVPNIKYDCYITVYNAHFKKISKVLHLVCCMRTCVEILPAESPLVSVSLDGPLVKLISQFNPGFSWLTHLHDVVQQFKVKLPQHFHRKIHKIISNVLESVVEREFEPQRRNIYAEFLISPHQSCVVNDQQEQEHYPMFTLPSIADLKMKISKNQSNNSHISGRYAVNASSTTSNKPMVLVAFVVSNPETGNLMLQDETGSIDCVATNLQEFSHTCKQSTCYQKQNQALHAPYSYTCPYAHIWNLDGLIRIKDFLMVHEQFGGEKDMTEQESVKTKLYIVFDMRKAVFLSSNYHQYLSNQPVTGCINEAHKETIIKILRKGNLMKRIRKTDSRLSFIVDAIIIPEQIRSTSEDRASSSLHVQRTPSGKNLTKRNIVLRFEGAAVKWYPVLYTRSCYRIIKQKQEDSDWDVLARISDHGTLSVSGDDIIEPCLPTFMKEETEINLCEVQGVKDIMSRYKLAKDLVSFTGVVVSCDMYTSHQPTEPEIVGMHVKVVDTTAQDSTQYLSVYIKYPIMQYPCGILQQAVISVRGVEVDLYRARIQCQSGPLTSIQILHIPNTVLDSKRLKKQEILSDVPSRYAIHILNSLLCGNKENCFIINGYLNALYSLDIRWVCYMCKSHRPCTCSSQSQTTGDMSFKARFLIDDGTAIVHSWCSESRAIASILGLPDTRWQQILDVIQTDGPFHFNLFDNTNHKSNNVLNLLDQLCRTRQTQQPIQLQCTSAYIRSTDNDPGSNQLWVRATVIKYGFRWVQPTVINYPSGQQ